MAVEEVIHHYSCHPLKQPSVQPADEEEAAKAERKRLKKERKAAKAAELAAEPESAVVENDEQTDAKQARKKQKQTRQAEAETKEDDNAIDAKPAKSSKPKKQAAESSGPQPLCLYKQAPAVAAMTSVRIAQCSIAATLVQEEAVQWRQQHHVTLAWCVDSARLRWRLKSVEATVPKMMAALKRLRR